MKRRSLDDVPKCCICSKPCRRAKNSKGLQVCSKECRQKKNTKQCKGCGKPFFSRPGRKVQYCSHECYAPACKVVRCPGCGGEFKEIKKRCGRRKRYCSMECANKQIGQQKLAENIEAWRAAKICVCGKPRRYQKGTCGDAECIKAVIEQSNPYFNEPPWAKAVRRAWNRLKSRAIRRRDGGNPIKLKCRTAASVLRKRRIAGAGRVRVRQQCPSDTDEAIKQAAKRHRERVKRRIRNFDPIWRKAESAAANLRKRRRLKNARSKANHRERPIRTVREPGGQVRIDWQAIE